MAAAGGSLISGKTAGLSSQICEKFGPNLDTCPEGTILGLRLDSSGGLHLHINGMDQGVAVPDVPQPCHALVDLYGQCEQVSGSGGGEEWCLGGWAVRGQGKSGVQGGDQQALGAGHTLADHPSRLQVTIVTPEPGAASGKSAGTQGDMEKADMVDGEPAEGARIPPHPHLVLLAPGPVTCAPSAPSGIKESVCWGPPPTASPLKSCEYHALCSRFQELLLLPGESPVPQNLAHSRPSPGPWPEPWRPVAKRPHG